VCPTIKKDTNTSLKIPFATSNDQKQKRIDICCPLHNYQVERGELEATALHKWVLQVGPAMTTNKPPFPQALPRKGVSFRNHQKVYGTNVQAVSQDRARVLQMNPPCG
jgi:hypothetical protein